MLSNTRKQCSLNWFEAPTTNYTLINGSSAKAVKNILRVMKPEVRVNWEKVRKDLMYFFLK